MILAGDIGGTKTVLGLFEPVRDDLGQIREATFPSKDHGSLEEILVHFLAEEPNLSLKSACFGVAGPVVDGRCQTTNLPWIVEEGSLVRATGAPRVKLLNDVEAAAYGMFFLRPDELRVLNSGQGGRKGNAAVIAAGTGLGEGILYWDGKQHHPIATEGGHVDLAPRTDQEIELLCYLRQKFAGRVSYERVLSGPGIHAVYSFLRDSGHVAEPSWLVEKLRSGDPSETISQLAVAGEDPLCVAALDLFCTIYGAEAGNLALKCMAVGGVFVGGGIAPKILPLLEKGNFMQGFTDKGRFADLLGSIRVSVALNPRAPLVGAVRYAQRL